MGFSEPSNYPSIFNKQLVSNEYTIHFSQEFEHPSYYDEVVSLLLSAEEVDSIVFVITKGEDDKVIYFNELPKY